jgi:hypothetical protein
MAVSCQFFGVKVYPGSIIIKLIYSFNMIQSFWLVLSRCFYARKQPQSLWHRLLLPHRHSRFDRVETYHSAPFHKWIATHHLRQYLFSLKWLFITHSRLCLPLFALSSERWTIRSIYLFHFKRGCRSPIKETCLLLLFLGNHV